MANNLKLKKTIAREILLFFSIIALTGVVWLFLLIWNYYFDNKAKSHQEQLKIITSKIDSLPSDKIKALYEGIKEDLVVNFLVNGDTYAIPLKEKKDFLKDYPTSKTLPANPAGYSVFETKTKFDDYGVPIHKTIDFDYVDFPKFNELLIDSLYRNKFYSTFSSSYDLGTRQLFETKINRGLKVSVEIKTQQKKLFPQKQSIQDLLNAANNSIKDNSEIWKIVSWTFLILAITVYPYEYVT